MDEVTVATIGLGFNPNESLISKKLPFPQNAEIFSVKSKSNEPTIQITYMAPAENFEKRPYDYISIVICKCNQSVRIAFDNHVYLGSIDIGNNTYAVFYKK